MNDEEKILSLVKILKELMRKHYKERYYCIDEVVDKWFERIDDELKKLKSNNNES